eukprot:7221044-Alexandrium_andersonii.AAC.1
MAGGPSRASGVRNLNCQAPEQTQKTLPSWHPKLPGCVFCAFVRANSESADKAGRRARRRRFSWG